ITEGKGDLDLTGIDDDELDGYIMTAEEAKLKSDLWMKVHADYLQEQKEKQEKKEREKEESAKSDQKKRKRRTKKKVQSQANTAGEAIEKMLQEKKISTKINYDVLKSLKDQDLKSSSSPAKNECPQPSLDSPIRRDSKSSGSKIINGGVPPSGISNLITSIISTKRLSSERSPESMECSQSTRIAEVETAAEFEVLADNSIVTSMVGEEDKILDDIPVEDPEHEDEDLEEDIEEETDAHLSVAQLLGHYRGYTFTCLIIDLIFFDAVAAYIFIIFLTPQFLQLLQEALQITAALERLKIQIIQNKKSKLYATY
ncbi:transcription factor IIIB 90 kDa subunit-like, partial [Limulus polyphemus]|uniref:Transcription factor IIIB 90 kDa subunit-like n=1 Tax=Limulus polyphemus TaxID=6850 RepID=A0ABM1B015_LIMPO